MDVLNLQLMNNMIYAKTFEIRTGTLSLSLTKLIRNAKAILKTYQPFIYGDVYYQLIL